MITLHRGTKSIHIIYLSIVYNIVFIILYVLYCLRVLGVCAEGMRWHQTIKSFFKAHKKAKERETKCGTTANGAHSKSNRNGNDRARERDENQFWLWAIFKWGGTGIFISLQIRNKIKMLKMSKWRPRHRRCCHRCCRCCCCCRSCLTKISNYVNKGHSGEIRQSITNERWDNGNL